MATKAQRARREAEVSGSRSKLGKKKGPTTTRRPSPPKDGRGTGEHNELFADTKRSKAAVAFEDSAGKHASRKSTRRSANRSKPDSPMRTAKTILLRLTSRGGGPAARR